MKEELEKPMQERKPNKVRGGIGGIGKTFRAILTLIQNGDTTFKEAFHGKTGLFLIARKDGKKLMKTCMYR